MSSVRSSTRPIVSMSSIVVASKEQVSSELAREVVILDLKAGIYYGLNAVGARIWNLIQEPKTVGEVRDMILTEYDVEGQRCEDGLLRLLAELIDLDLVEIK